MAQQFLAKRTWNPVDVFAGDLRLPMAGMGVVAAYIGRRYAFTAFRNVFGYAIRMPDGRVRYVAVDPTTGQPMRNVELPGAWFNRLGLNVGTVAAGAVLIGQSSDGVFDYIGVGMVAGGVANIILNLFGIE